METLYRFFKLDGILRSRRRPVSSKILCEELECSPATFKRLIRIIREQYNYPIKNCRKEGYFYDANQVEATPGLWFSADQLQALLMMKQWLERLQPNLIHVYFQSLIEHVEKILSLTGKTAQDICQRIQIIPIAQQYIPPHIFLALNQAVLNHKKLNIKYRDIQDQHTKRVVSPQRLIYYRDQWYLDAWCHLRESLRTFWIAGLVSVEIVNEQAKQIDEEMLIQHLEASYGIFTGEPTHVAHLRFIGQAAMRVRNANWHAQQNQLCHENGSVELWVPYSDPRELIMDILKYGAEVTVLAPDELRAAVICRLKKALNLYNNILEDQYVSL